MRCWSGNIVGSSLLGGQNHLTLETSVFSVTWAFAELDCQVLEVSTSLFLLDAFLFRELGTC